MNKLKSEQSPVYAGIDISKEALDISLAGQSPRRYANDTAGIAKLVNALKKLPEPAWVICEPSGGYERDLLEALWAGMSQRSLKVLGGRWLDGLVSGIGGLGKSHMTRGGVEGAPSTSGSDRGQDEGGEELG